MPELPEVETIRRGLARRLTGARLVDCVVREGRLRRPVDDGALADLVGARLGTIGRRAKYLLIGTDRARTIIVHLGMSGRVVIGGELGAPARHDHVVWWFETRAGERVEVRLNDPRRFGLVVVETDERLQRHPLLAHLGPEPLDPSFTPEVLRRGANGSRRGVKSLLMDARIVVGIGNIYASEALWRARVLPGTRAGRISPVRWERIHTGAVGVLRDAIEAGGTTLRDYRDAEGNLGYFAMSLDVYGREGMSCRRCGGRVRRRVDLGRSTFYCPVCQH